MRCKFHHAITDGNTTGVFAAADTMSETEKKYRAMGNKELRAHLRSRTRAGTRATEVGCLNTEDCIAALLKNDALRASASQMFGGGANTVSPTSAAAARPSTTSQDDHSKPAFMFKGAEHTGGASGVDSSAMSLQSLEPSRYGVLPDTPQEHDAEYELMMASLRNGKRKHDVFSQPNEPAAPVTDDDLHVRDLVYEDAQTDAAVAGYMSQDDDGSEYDSSLGTAAPSDQLADHEEEEEPASMEL